MPDTRSPQPPSTGNPTGTSWRQLVGPLGMLGLLIILGRIAGSRWPEIETTVEGAGLMGWAIFVFAAALLAACCFPVAGLALSAGALYGLWPGLLLVVMASLVSALVMFALGRGLLRGRIQSIISSRPRLAVIDRLVGDRAVRLNLLTRLAPLNFGLSSYTLAAGPSGLGAYMIGTMGAWPATFVYVWLGWAARGVGRGQGSITTGTFVVLGIGIFAVGLLTWVVTRIVRQAFREADAEESTDSVG